MFIEVRSINLPHFLSEIMFSDDSFSSSDLEIVDYSTGFVDKVYHYKALLEL